MAPSEPDVTRCGLLEIEPDRASKSKLKQAM